MIDGTPDVLDGSWSGCPSSPTRTFVTRRRDRSGVAPAAQGPISIFIHHNTLHAFEALPFEDGVEQAAARVDRQPFLSEARSHAKLASGRILARDVHALLADELGERGTESIAKLARRPRRLERRMDGLCHGPAW
jgi:hypothetical protein